MSETPLLLTVCQSKREVQRMSTDRTTEILNYLSAISREVGELRTGMNSLRTEVSQLRTEVTQLRTEVSQLRTEVNTRLDRIERAQRLLNRMGSVVLETRADVEELQDRVDTLEGK
jgi:chromosome segregation ATPase